MCFPLCSQLSCPSEGRTDRMAEDNMLPSPVVSGSLRWFPAVIEWRRDGRPGAIPSIEKFRTGRLRTMAFSTFIYTNSRPLRHRWMVVKTQKEVKIRFFVSEFVKATDQRRYQCIYIGSCVLGYCVVNLWSLCCHMYSVRIGVLGNYGMCNFEVPFAVTTTKRYLIGSAFFPTLTTYTEYILLWKKGDFFGR